MLTGLVGLSVLLGLGVFPLMLVFLFSRRLRRSPVWKVGVVFGILGLVIPLADRVIGIDKASDRWFWPTSVPFVWLGDPSDSLWQKILLLGIAMLSNIGFYGGIGFAVGLVWSWIGPKTANPPRSDE